ncbi:helix-turn-helix domain-containing protein [Actinomadura oligospora]|uniref:helix-turn-helix domain-containing protein n=1 Tax=Actinomadura oligospora TaxID=111804 RepID=UPI0004AE39FD|nr:RICIN domain-containing protein [Actinomadura oligospora]
MDVPTAPVGVPDNVRTVAELVAEMRQLKARSGLTVRKLEARAARTGASLPRSTLTDVLNQERLPRRELLAAFVAACGGDEQAVTGWLAVRDDLACSLTCVSEPDPADLALPDADPGEQAPASVADPTGSPSASSPSPPPVAADHDVGRRFRFWQATLLGGILLLGLPVAVLGLAPWRTPPLGLDSQAAVTVGPTSPSAGSPISGRYRFRGAASGRCLSERATSNDGQIVQAPCADARPALGLQAQSDGTYRITAHHPELGPGCLGVRYATRDPGPWVYNDYCGRQGANLGGENFRLVPVAAPGRGHQIIAVHSLLCLSMPDDAGTRALPVLQRSCDPADPHQTFLLERM